MKTFLEVDYQAVEWAGRWKYALRSGQTVIGTIYLKEDFRAQAIAESAEGCLLFEKKWFPTERVKLRQADSPADVGVFRNTWTRKKAAWNFATDRRFIGCLRTFGAPIVSLPIPTENPWFTSPGDPIPSHFFWYPKVSQKAECTLSVLRV